MELLAQESKALDNIAEEVAKEKANSVEFKDLQEILKMDGISINSREFLNEVESYLGKKGVEINYRLNESADFKSSLKGLNEAFDDTFDKHQLKVDLYTDDSGAIGEKKDLDGENITLLYKKGTKFTYDIKDKTFEAPDKMVIDVSQDLFESMKQGEYVGGEMNEHCEEDIKAFLNSVVEDSWKQENLDALTKKIDGGGYNPLRAKELINMITTYALTCTSATAGEEENVELNKKILELSNEMHGISEEAGAPEDLSKDDIAKLLNDISVNGFEVEGADVKVIEPSLITDILADDINGYAKSFSKNEGFDAKDVDVLENPTEDKGIYLEGLMNICSNHDITIK